MIYFELVNSIDSEKNPIVEIFTANESNWQQIGYFQFPLIVLLLQRCLIKTLAYRFTPLILLLIKNLCVNCEREVLAGNNNLLVMTSQSDFDEKTIFHFYFSMKWLQFSHELLGIWVMIDVLPWPETIKQKFSAKWPCLMMIRLGGTLQLKQCMQINARLCCSFFFFFTVNDLHGGSLGEFGYFYISIRKMLNLTSFHKYMYVCARNVHIN